MIEIRNTTIAYSHAYHSHASPAHLDFKVLEKTYFVFFVIEPLTGQGKYGRKYGFH